MKPEPLDGKIYVHNVKNEEGKTNKKYPYHFDTDIKLAVKWLKKYNKQSYDNPHYQEWIKIFKDRSFKPKFRAWIVNKAFKDVIK